MLKKTWRAVTSFFLHPELKDIRLTLRLRVPWEPVTGMERKSKEHEENMEAIALATFEHQKDAAQKNLIILHRSVMVALFAAVVAVILGVIAIESKPTVVVRPVITIRSAH